MNVERVRRIVREIERLGQEEAAMIRSEMGWAAAPEVPSVGSPPSHVGRLPVPASPGPGQIGRPPTIYVTGGKGVG